MVETGILGGIEVRPVQGEVVGVGGVRCAEPAPSAAGLVSAGVGAVNGARIGGAGQVNVVKSAIGPAAAPDMVTRLGTLDVLGGDGGRDVGSCSGHGDHDTELRNVPQLLSQHFCKMPARTGDARRGQHARWCSLVGAGQGRGGEPLTTRLAYAISARISRVGYAIAARMSRSVGAPARSVSETGGAVGEKGGTWVSSSCT